MNFPIPIIIFFVFFLIHLYVFMYQRATLTIARALDSQPVTQVQTILTPNWMGLFGWISTLGLFGSYVLIWLQMGLLWVVIIFVLNQLASAIVPIPSRYFYTLIEKHLVSETKKLKDGKDRAALVVFLAQVKQIMSNYKVS